MNGLLCKLNGKLTLVLTLIVTLGITSAFGQASAKEQWNPQKQQRIAQAIFDAAAYNEVDKTFSFDESKVVNAGLPKDMAVEIKNRLESLGGSDAEKVYQDQLAAQKKGEATTMVAPLVIWAAKVLAGAGLAWLGKKLLDMGGHEFCKRYKNENKTTKYVCKFL
ncbi:hypothetical protein ABEX69_09265 [Bacillus safensis]|uniref:hypothetical protein n=1 Tax=Bacillus safensis TaxID=561879 RepID=UPI00227E8A8F|nr:hypothetical protein [Bacillus safensis]MCY7565750.1 hypothetical protein [Bacillus safensis]MCY7626350.1 hypothetical protein [Bacillus safensis]MCY7634613.1 hypothetical protein [Bacillus safensis]MCY7649406.1 hypothetical protein [Bacillus safensis]MCY7650923.1 hypothetical protein [Bacillus safensis]